MPMIEAAPDCGKLQIRGAEGVSMNKNDEMLRHEFPSGEEPTAYTADICAEAGHQNRNGIETTIEGYEVKSTSASKASC